MGGAEPFFKGKALGDEVGRKSNVSLADPIYNVVLSLRVTLACFAFW